MPTHMATMASATKISDRVERAGILGSSTPNEVEANVIGGLCLEFLLDRNSGGSLDR
jgi:hypothetical protein